MNFELFLTPEVAKQLQELKNNPGTSRAFKDVVKTLNLMKTNLRHPSLNTHEYHGIKTEKKEKIFESYAQQKTSGAYRIFWHYGPEKSYLTIMLIIPHP
jgi:hypothetical protein